MQPILEGELLFPPAVGGFVNHDPTMRYAIAALALMSL
jgi:hypothetical protein